MSIEASRSYREVTKPGLFGKKITRTFFDVPEFTPKPKPTQKKTKSKAASVEKDPNKLKKYAKVGAFVAAAALTTHTILMTTGQVEADENTCPDDPEHQQIVVEDNFQANYRSLVESAGFSKGEQTIKGVTRLLEERQGYDISEAQVVRANAKSDMLQYNDEGKLKSKLSNGAHCVDVPGPIYGGFERVDSKQTLGVVATAHLISVAELKKMNPIFKSYEDDDTLEEGAVLKVDSKPNKNFVYREMSRDENDINTMSNGDAKKRSEILEQNAALIGNGKAVSKGKEAFLPVEGTEWMKKKKLDLKDIHKAFPTTEITTGEVEPAPETNAKPAIDKKDNPISHEASVKATVALAERGPTWEHRAEAMRFFIDQGFTDYQAAGLVGNFVVESGSLSLPPHAEQYGGGPGRGVVQWEGGRRSRLKHFAKELDTSWKNFDTQLKFIVHEYKTTEKKGYRWLTSTTNVKQATNAVLNGYERPAARKIKPRLQPAKATLNEYHKAARKYS